MTHFNVIMTKTAARDLSDIIAYISEHDSPDKADHVLDRIDEALKSLSEYPNRGTHPKEMLALGVRDFREIFFKPYRLIYEVVGKNVYVYVIADGRRDIQSLLQRRLLHR